LQEGENVPTPRSPLAPKCPHVISFYDAYTDAHSDSVSMVLEYMNAGTLQVSVQCLKNLESFEGARIMSI
jgi:hypothetical protein